MTTIRHTELLPEEYLQGLVERLSSTDLQIEEMQGDDDLPPARDPSYELQKRHDFIADEILRQLINWHRDSFKICFTSDEGDLEFLKSISTPEPSALEQAQIQKAKAEANLSAAQAAELKGTLK